MGILKFYQLIVLCGLYALGFVFGVSSNEPMLLFYKRTFQPSTIRQKWNHGFFARWATKSGKKSLLGE